MVSLNPNPPAGQGFWLDAMKMGLPGVDSSSENNNNAAAAATRTVDSTSANANSKAPGELNKKVRKPYTITKSRESWTDQEHDKFLEALQLFDRDWKKIEAFVGSKTVIQIRSHAQKYFLKVQKSGKSEHVPPPRPKRKAAYPYPQKASKNALVVSEVTGPFQSSSALLEPGCVVRPDSLLLPGNPITNPTTCYWPSHTAPLVDASQITKDEVGLSCSGMTQNCCSSSNESTPWMWPCRESNDQEKQQLSQPAKALPDFAKVYSFIASVFDPNASGHLQKLKNMDPINVETVLLLMKNLSVNLTSPEFEDQRKMLLSYGIDAEKAKSSSLCNDLYIYNNAIPSI